MAGNVYRSSDLAGDVGRESIGDIGPLSDVCVIHKGKLVVYFCTNHGAYCCSQCKRENHGQCADIAPLLKRKKAKLIQEFNGSFPGDKAEPVINDCAFLQDGRLLLLDASNKKLKVFGPDFSVQYGKHFEEHPKRVAVLDKDEVAVSFFENQKVRRMSVDRPIKDTGVLSLDFQGSGMQYIDRKTLIVLDVQNSLRYISVEGKKLSKISNTKFQQTLVWPMDCCLNETKSVVFVSNHDGNSVCAIELKSKKVLSAYKHDDLKSPKGTSIDSDGYVYVCGSESNNIHQLSSDGHHVGILLSLPAPKAVTFHPDGSVFIVVNKTSQFKVYSFET